MDWVVELRSPGATVLFLALTALGDIAFYLVAISLGYWLLDRRRFRLLGLVTLAAGVLNSLLKGFWQAPRPADIPWLAEAEGFSFPSGHAQLAATFWIWWALEVRRRWAWILAAALVAGIAASRVYLGLHFPRDVAAGILIGLGTVAAAWRPAHHPPDAWQRLGAWQALVWAAGLALVWSLFPAGIDHVAAVSAGSLVGIALGSARLPAALPLPRGPAPITAVLVLGLGVTFGLRVGLKPVGAALGIADHLADALRYGVIALWISWWAPLLFARFRNRDQPAGDASPIS